MSLSKAVISGIVVRDAEKRFTNDGLAILNFTMNIDKSNDTLLRVFMYGDAAEKAESKIKKGTVVTCEGRLQTNSYKDSNGEDKKVVELYARSYDISGEVDINMDANAPVDMDYLPDEVPDELIGDDEIPF